MEEKKYWRGLEELNPTLENQEAAANEFREELPLADLPDSLLGATTPRRDFLKYLGFSTAAAVIASSCEMPVRKAIPYAIKPEDITPGVANYYASTFCDGGDYCAVIIKCRDGRPIKIEGNNLSSVTRGGTSARVQASVLSLYDTARLRGPYAGGKMQDMYTEVDGKIAQGLAAAGGKTVYLLTGTINSPTVLQAIDRFKAKYPNVRHVMYDAMSASAILEASQNSHGVRAIPGYRFDNADTIVSLDADFLGTWLSPVAFAKQYSLRRKVSAKNPTMSRHYQVESLMSISGAAADRRAVCRPSELGAVAAALYAAVSGGGAPNLSSPALNTLITQAAADLKQSRGLVVSGSNDVNVQTLVHAINSAIGANGSTIDWTATSNARKGLDTEMAQLVADMNAGSVGALLVHGANPVYDYFDSAAVVSGMAKVPLKVSFADRIDETAAKCDYITPDHHYLESWGDAEPLAGYYSLMQPGISPLFKTRAFADSLLLWAGDTTNYADLWKSFWMGKMGSQAGFDQALQDGVIEPGGHWMANRDGLSMSNQPVMDLGNQNAAGGSQGIQTSTIGSGAPALGAGTGFSGNAAAAAAAVAAAPKAGGVEVVTYQKVGIGHGGCWSNNPWLQELPDPITKATWDNYACISHNMARKLDEGKAQEYEITSINQVNLNRRMITIKANGKSITAATVVVPGMHDDVVGLAVGYGRVATVGKAAANLGHNTYPMQRMVGTTRQCFTPGTIEKAAGRYPLAITQSHYSYEGRNFIQETTLADFKAHPDKLLKKREDAVGHYAHLPWLSNDHGDAHGGGHDAGADKAPLEGSYNGEVAGANNKLEQGFRENGSLYPDYKHLGIHWGMSIDLNSCIGCGACVIGCQAENNVSVVGKDKVLVAQEMHWLSIDRYFSGDPKDPNSIQTVFQPMLCQHCDNAPCENVCPVSATNHSSEGLNQMAYNRCIGTKYCANNCPYKVRRFNWMDWNGADCFEDNLYEDGRRDEINDNLTRMVLNPDVTVRSRGVMEKCTFCVQRLQEGKLDAKKEGRPVMDGEIKTACQQACPTDAILFGNVNDKQSAIYRTRAFDQRERTFYALEELHVLPNVNYLSKVRNTDHVVGGDEQKDIMMKEHI